MSCKLQVNELLSANQPVMSCEPTNCEFYYTASYKPTNLRVSSLRAYELQIKKLTISVADLA